MIRQEMEDKIKYFPKIGDLVDNRFIVLEAFDTMTHPHFPTPLLKAYDILTMKYVEANVFLTSHKKYATIQGRLTDGLSVQVIEWYQQLPAEEATYPGQFGCIVRTYVNCIPV